MKKITYIFLVWSFLFQTDGYGQKNISDYSYVVVAQQFEFQRNKDQYHVNTLARHLFNTNGFNALYEVELGDLPRCEGLYADVIKKSAFLSTKLIVVLKDCNNVEIFRSEEGRSKAKDFREAYHEALKDAFVSIKAQQVKQKDINQILVSKTEKELPETKKEDIVVIDGIDVLNYSYGGETFVLLEEDAGLVLYKATDEMELIGRLNPTSRQGIYLFVTDESSTLASFDENKNLVVDAVDDSGNTVQKVYVLRY